MGDRATNIGHPVDAGAALTVYCRTRDLLCDKIRRPIPKSTLPDSLRNVHRNPSLHFAGFRCAIIFYYRPTRATPSRTYILGPLT